MINLQIGCLIIICYIMAIYFGAKRTRSYEHTIFVAILIGTAVNLILDMITVYTVWYVDQVPALINRILHLIFYATVLNVVYLVFLYIVALINQDVEVFKSRYKWIKLPPIVPVIVMCCLPIYYKKNPTINYSYGPSPTLLYLVVACYFLMSLILVIRYRENINAKKKTIILVALAIQGGVTVYEAIFPTWLISSFGLTMLCLAFFITLENPDVRLVEVLKEEKQKAEQANAAKSVFIASVSHEIRTPINGVIGMNEMILRESHETPVKEYAMNVKTAAHTLLSLVNDILDLTKIESGKMEIHPVKYELCVLLNDVYQMIAQRADAKGLKLQLQIAENLPTELFGDDVRVKQVLTNLLTNAVKYTETGTVTMRVNGLTQGERIVLRFEVEDTGIGIKEENIPKLFRAFERVDEIRNRKIEGTGLGIALTQQFLEMMGSKLEVQSEYGKGSTFSFQLEQTIVNAKEIGNFEQRIKEKSKNYVYQSSFYAPKAKVLIVDDSRMNRRVFAALLKQTGVQIAEADCGKACLERMAKEHFDLIFLDQMMPDMDGITTFNKMKELKENLCVDTPVIAFSADAAGDARQKYISVGFGGFLLKPVVPDKLEELLRTNLPAQLVQENSADGIL